MKNLFFLFFFFVLILKLNAQDIIIQKNGNEISAKILEIDSGSIKYKKLDNMNGPTYIIPKSEVFIIKYENGTKDIINNLEQPDIELKARLAKRIFKEKQEYILLGYGFGSYSYSLNSNDYYQQFNSSLLGPFYIKYEYGMSEDFGIGVNLAYEEFDNSYYYNNYTPNSGYNNYLESSHYNSFSALLRANWHYGNSDKVDPYFGFGIGYRSSNSTNYSNSSWINGNNSFPLGFETTFGVRMLFSKHIGAYAETGIAKSVIQFGLMLK